MATWLQQFGNWNTNLNAGIFGDKNAAGVMQQASGFGKAMGSLGISAGNIGGIANTIGQLGTGLLAGQNQTGVGNALQTIGGLASNIPGVGGLIGAGVGVVGGLVNAAFGSNINEEFVNQTRSQANAVGSRVFNSNTNADLLNDWQSMVTQSNVSKSEVGSDGWFSNKASRETARLNERINEANRRQLANFGIAAANVDAQNDLRILQNMAAYGGPINSFRKYYADGGLLNTPQFFTFEPQIFDDGGYLSKAKALIRQNEGFMEKPYADSPKGKNWRSVGYGFNDSGFRDKYPEGISKHYEHGITKKQAEEELDYFLNKAEKQLKSIYGKQWNDFTDSQKAAILDTYYQRPASVGKSSRFYKAVTAGEDPSKYLGVAGFNKRNNIRQNVFSDGKFTGQEYSDSSNTEDSLTYPSSILEATSPISELDLSGIEPTKVINPEINLSYPSLDLNFLTSSQKPIQQQVPTIGTVEDFLASYGDFEQNLFGGGGKINKYDEPQTFAGRMVEAVGASPSIVRGADVVSSVAQMTPWGHYVAATDLGRDLNRVYHKEQGAKKDALLDVISMIPGISAPQLKAASNAWNTLRGNSKIRKSLNAGILSGKVADFIDDTYGADRVSKALGGELNNDNMNIFDFGGGMTHGVNWDTGINWVDEGGSHGENPLGGVQMGVDEQGIPNLVEEGEAIWNGDYVFSRRMKVPKKLRDKYKLPDGATFADAVKVVTKESEERPNDEISRATQDYILGEFADSQEELRAAKAQRAMDKQMQLQDDFLMGMQFGLGGALFADGGGIHIDPSKKGTFKAQASKMGMGVQEAASHILANKENYSPAMVKKANFARNASHWHEDGGSLFENPFDGYADVFAYGGELGNIFEGEGDRPNVLNLDAANQSLVRRIFGDTRFTRFMENTAEALNDPIGYFAGDEIDAIMDKVAQMSEPQLQRFFSTRVGQAVASAIDKASSSSGTNAQEAGIQRWARATGRMAKPIQRTVVESAKRAMAQSRQAARSQMRTPKGGGSQKVLNETMTPAQAARRATTGSTEGLPQGWNFTRGNTSTVTTEKLVQDLTKTKLGDKAFTGRTAQTSRVNPKSPTGKAATSRGTAPDPFTELEGTLNMRAPIGSGNFGYLPWVLGGAGVGGAGYGLYKGIDWMADNLTNPDGTISGVNDPVTQAAINSLPSEATSNKGTNNGGKAAVTETPVPAIEEKLTKSGKKGQVSSSKKLTNSSAKSSVGGTGLNTYKYDPIETFKYWDKDNNDYDGGYRDFIENKLNEDWISRVMSGQYGDMSRYKGANSINPTVEQAWQLGLDKKNSDWHKAMAAAYDDYVNGIDPKTGEKVQAVTRAAIEEGDPEWTVDFGDPDVMKNIQAGLNLDGSKITDNNTGLQRSPFKPKQTWTRYAPIAMNALFGLKEMLTPADYTNANAIMEAAYQAGQPVSVGTEYIGDYRKRDPFDPTYLMNTINQNAAAANRNFMNISGGNRAVAMSGILANDLITQRSLAEAARQAYLANRTDDAQVAEFNRGTNIFNAQAQNTRNLSLAQLNSQRQNAMLSGIAQGARLRQAIKDQRDAAISANLTAFAQGLGDLGKENGYYNMLGGLNDEGILKYFYGDNWNTKFNV